MNNVKPYTDEELREAREHMARCADREFISVVEFRRLLATLDERDRRLAESMPPRALREWREALGEYAPEDTGGWSPLVGATHAVVRDLNERTRERDEARKWLIRERDKLALSKMSEARLIDERDALRAAEAERDDLLAALDELGGAEGVQALCEQVREVADEAERRLRSSECLYCGETITAEEDTRESRHAAWTAHAGVCNEHPLRREVAALRERLSVVERERDAEEYAASNHAAEAERMLRSACDLRDALDSVAGALGVDTSTDADTEARACVAAVVALREEVERLRSAVGGEQD